ncbi:hypothetical protein [Streptomyces sp. NPDC005322]|uniref:hypothetical protein n=1 Tax=Streptomyces sp. NPDC005322 TaxID=3157032 RepID=UPI0033A58D65
MNGLRRAAARLSAGSGIVARRRIDWAAAWCRRGYRDDLTGWRAALGPAVRALVLAGAAVVVWLIVRARPWLMWVLAAGWLIAAWRASRPASGEEAEADAAGADPAAAEEAFRQLLRDAVGDRTGVHLVDVLALLHRAGHFPGWEVADVRAACERAGVPVRRSVKVAGKVTWGVHRDDLPGPAEAPSPGEAADRAA